MKEFLPYKSRHEAVTGALGELGELFLWMERNWFDVSEGRLSEEEIHQLHMDIKDRKFKIERNYFGGAPLPERVDLLAKAEADTTKFLGNYFS